MEPEISYFELQAHMGTTKHLGGLDSTRELISRCQVSADAGGLRVLDAGCGVGATACYLVKTYGCRVTGIDLRESMVERARERAQREGIGGRATFRTADVRDLPFEDESFDVVLCESVATFVEDKQQVVDELVRVVKAGGRVGLNEQVWLQPPTEEMRQFARHMWDITAEIPTQEDWERMLTVAGVGELDVRICRYDPRREASQVKRYRARELWLMFWRTAGLFVKSASFRAYMAKRERMPKGFFDHLAYVTVVGTR
jgi:arsenite methyltransferase